MKTTYFKIKKGKQYKIKKPSAKTKNSLLDNGYTVTELIEDGNKTKIISYSPGKRQNNLISRLHKIK